MLTIYIDMDDVLCDYSSKIKEHRQKNPDNPFPQSVPGFFRSLEPVEAKNSLGELILFGK